MSQSSGVSPDISVATATNRPSATSKDEDLSAIIPMKNAQATPLPPMNTSKNDSLLLTKKRKLQLTGDPDGPLDKSHLIPIKSSTSSRAGSSSSKGTTRVPSLGDTFKPELSPATSNQSYRSFEESPSIIRTTSTPIVDKRILSSPPKISSESTPNATEIKALKRKENDLDTRIRREKSKLETLKRAKTILSKHDPDNNNKLVEKWRDAAQKASNFLLSAALDKVSKVGGKKEFVRREREKIRETMEYTIDSSFQDRIGEVTQSEEYQQLPENEQEDILKRLEGEQEAAMKEAERYIMRNSGANDNNENENDDDNDDDFTMKDLYKRLKMDYKLVFPND